MLGLLLVRRLWRSAVLAALTLSLAACTAGAPSDRSERADPPPAPAQARTPVHAGTGPAQTPAILSFSAPKLGGGQVVGSELVGQDLAIFFWAPW